MGSSPQTDRQTDRQREGREGGRERERWRAREGGGGGGLGRSGIENHLKDRVARFSGFFTEPVSVLD